MLLNLKTSLVCAALLLANVGVVHASDGPRPLADMPMTLIGGRVPMIQVAVGARRDLNFIVDTGASDEIIDATVAKELAIAVGNPTMVDQPGGKVPIGKTAGVDAALGTIVLKSWPFVTAPLKTFEPLLGRSFDGILGQKFFESYVVEFDYAQQRMRLFDAAAFKYAGSGALLPLQQPDGRLFVGARLEGPGSTAAEGLLQLDTGSFEAVGLDGPDVERLKLVPSSAPKAPLIGGETSGFRTRFRSVSIGPYRIQGPIASVTTSANAGNDPVSLGVVGGEILRRFKLFVLAERRQVILEPNAAIGEPDGSDASGLVLVSPRPFDRVFVYAVLAGSAAAEGGMRAGDELAAVDRSTAAMLRLEGVSRLLAVPGRTYQLKLRRDGAEFAVTIKTRQPV